MLKSLGITGLLLVSAAITHSGAAQAHAADLVGVTRIGPATFLIKFDPASQLRLPKTILLVTGVTPGEQLVAIDSRPATGQLFGVGSTRNANGTSRLYSIDLSTGAATVVGSSVTPDLTKAGDGSTRFGLDFNPTIDRLRLVSDADQNLVFNPDTGAVTPAVNLFYAPGDVNFSANPNVIDIAYDNNVAGATTSQQRGIDSNLDVLVTVANNTGVLATIGPLGVDVGEIGGFEVAADGTAYAVLKRQSGGVQRLYTINLQTGAATNAGLIALGLFEFVGIAALP